MRLGPITIPTLVYVMHSPLPYNIPLGRPWIHALGVATSTLHRCIKFIANNEVITIKVEPDVVHLCEMTFASWALVVFTLKNCIPSLSSDVLA